uniref:Secretory carrier-associated membrane protein n=1 Tax=Tetradesmus obliquus TaxID=3088 RepID=A0A383WI86_TETOB|eukprot:jgi/Sobl393_1/8069/SZX77131.1
MASGGWGGAYSNPFAAQEAAAAAAAAEEKVSAAGRQGAAYGAWGGSGTPAASTPAVPAFIAPTPVTATAAAGGNVTAREAELARREAELARREAQLAQAGAAGVIKNWPPCCPFIYHDIRAQIPSWNRSFVRFTYLVELISIFAFFYNAIIILATLFAGTGPGMTWWFLSVLALVLGVPLSWWLFYKSVFASAQTDGATYSYLRTFILIMLHMAWCVWMVLALPNLGSFSGGVFPMLDMFKANTGKGIAFGIMYVINICLWGIAGLGCWVVLGLAVTSYRRGDTPRRDYEARMGGVQMNAV